MKKEICCIKECDKQVQIHGMCPMHWWRFEKYGNPILVKVIQLHGKTTEERFWARVEKTDECWYWKGTPDRKGYGTIRLCEKNGKQKNISVHRYSWRLHNGEIPQGMCICHKCDMPSCVNPEHLFLGTIKDNNIDKLNKGRHRWGHMKGEEHGMAKLNAEKVLAIRVDNRSQKEIANEYGISRVTVYEIKIGKTWKHI